MPSRTVQVAIIGAGPAGLLLSQLLMARGIESIVVERQSRAHVEGRIRAGVLEQGTVDLLREAGASARLDREAEPHSGIEISLRGARQRIDLEELTGGKKVTLYGQTKIVQDLIATRLERGGEIVFQAEDVTPHDITSDQPRLTWHEGGEPHELRCDFIAGCDGFHGVSRSCIPTSTQKVFERAYPYGWFGILSRSPPPASELIYASHPRGFALYSMRPPTYSRLYFQCPLETDASAMSDDQIWEELRTRLGPEDGALLTPGPIIEKSVTPMRSFVAEPMRSGRLFLAGDAAHIVPPTGAKGLNLAASDARYLSWGLFDYYERGATGRLDAYSATALSRVWKAERFSWWMTAMLHKAADENTFEDRIRLAEIDYLLSSRAAMTTLAENYVGLPF